VEKVFFNKRDDLGEKVKCLEGNMSIECRPTKNFTFKVGTFQNCCLILCSMNG
jgi:hypothetical protein